MCKKEKKKKMDGALFNISPGWKVKLLPRSCIKTPPPWEAQPGKTNPPCVCSLAVQQSLSRRCDDVQNSNGGQRGEMEKMSVEETVQVLSLFQDVKNSASSLTHL